MTTMYTSRRRPEQPPAKKINLRPVLVLLLLCTLGFGCYRYTQPIGSPSVQEVLQVEQDTSPPVINWPLAQASIGTVEDGILASKPGQVPQPTASTAKLITVLTVLKEKPLALGEQGPILTIEQNDMAIYSAYQQAGGSLVDIQLGERLSQYQILQAILIRSSNNLADTLAIWAFGSLSAYQQAAQKLVDELGMTNTIVGIDASGLSPSTTSTAEDLTRLGIAAMKHEVVREIVRQPTSNLPIDGSKPSTNWMLGQNGVVGIKTGNTPQIGGVFVIASEYTPEGGKPTTIVGTVQGEVSTYTAIARAGQLAEAVKPLFVRKTIIKKGDAVARVSTPWGESSEVIADQDITTVGWKYAPVTPKIELRADAPFQKDAVLGKILVGEHSANLVAKDTIKMPSLKWRITTSR